ncbi:MAG: hypothetical protein SGBAC_002292 [Bacillariaceae sp.]
MSTSTNSRIQYLYFVALFLSCYWSSFLTNALSANAPGLSKQQVQTILNEVPIYAVTQANKEGIVLVEESDNKNQIAYFFFNPDTANAVFTPMREKAGIDSWEVVQFRLGMVWFELFKGNVTENVEYRLVPDSRELQAARSILDPKGVDPKLFSEAYDKVPIFVDQSLRVTGSDGEKKFPMYFSLQDLLESCQTASKEYKPEVNVAEFCNLVEQMQADDGENDFQNVALVPPTIMLVKGDDSIIDNSSKLPEDGRLETPTAMDNWD